MKRKSMSSKEDVLDGYLRYVSRKERAFFADRWAHMSDTAILSAFLSGCPSLSYDENKALFLLVQTFILDSNRF